MATVRFDSPGDMILKGIGLTLLGIVLLPFGIGFIGALFGPIWVIQGIVWAFRSSSPSTPKYKARKVDKKLYQNAQNALEELLMKVKLYSMTGSYEKAVQEIDSFVTNFGGMLTYEGKNRLTSLRTDLVRASQRQALGISTEDF